MSTAIDTSAARRAATNLARWAADPWGRFAQRYWDGERWTEHVATQAGGRGSLDPPPGGSTMEPADRPEPAATTDGPLEAPTHEYPPTSSVSPAGRLPGHAEREVDRSWRSDPTGRHAQRYWDGGQWTEFVAPVDGGAPTSDPVRAGDDLPTSGDEPPVDPTHALAVPAALGGASAIPAGDDSPTTGDEHVDLPSHALAAAAALGGASAIRAGDDLPTSGDKLPVHAPTDALAVPAAALGVANAISEYEPDALTEPPHWGSDPTGRFAQRYWDGQRWTDHVAGVTGGEPNFDPFTPTAVALGAGAGLAAIHWHAGGWNDAPSAPEVATLPVRAASSRRRWRWALAAAAALALLGLGAALLLSGVLHGPPSKTRASRPHLSAHPHGAAAPATAPATAPPTTVPVVAIPNTCVLLTPPQITQATTIPVGPAQPIPNGCVWRGPNALSARFSAQDRQTLSGLEGVIVFGHPAGVNPQSVSCDNGIVGIPAAAESAICTSSAGQYAMFELPNKVVVQISVRSDRAVPFGALTLLTQLAYLHAQPPS